MVRVRFTQVILAAILASAAAISGQGRSAGGKVQLVPHFSQGDTLRYQFELRTETTSQSSGPIANPEAAHALTLSVSALVRLEVLSVAGEEAAGNRTIHMRATYEKSVVETHGDAFDPEQETLEEQYRKLEGHSIEFTIAPDGHVSEITGLEEILPNQAAAASVKDWLSGIARGASLPDGGIAVGQKWSSERPVQAAPLAGLAWKTDSIYLRNEICGATGSAAEPPMTAPDDCAIILTKFQIDERHIPSDPTPEEYRRNSLRTSGKWTGSGESLTAISLRAGLVMSVTQSGTENMDVTIASATETTSVHYAGSIKTQSQITLVPASTATSR